MVERKEAIVKKILSVLILLTLFVISPVTVFAQSYYFSLDQLVANVFWNEDGTASIDYVFVFTNDVGAHPIDYVDVGLPNSSFDESNIMADVNGQPLTDISKSGYQGSGTGVAIGLGQYAIQPGETGTVHVYVGSVRRVLHQDSDDSNYASAVFSPTWFGEEYMYGQTDMTVIFQLPPAVLPAEPKWHKAPNGFPSEPQTALGNQGRVTYTWNNPYADGSSQYKFGASFPKKYVPASAIIKPSLWDTFGIDEDAVISLSCCGGIIGFIFLMVFLSYRSTEKRKLQYMSPKIAIEGHGIKRGLTAVEAAILLEQPLDKVLTMILFGLIKKNAVTVIKRDPLDILASETLPEGLHEYERKFLKAFEENTLAERRKALQNLTIDLVQAVSQKMKGFSRKETVAYYRDITQRAWKEVENADTPEIKSEKYSNYMEWTMLDKDYDDRTRDVFRTGPVFVPTWWHRFDPSYGGPISTSNTSMPTSTSIGGGASLPHLPGSDFAASVVNGTQNFAGSVIGNVTDFTNSVTKKTNPIPVVKSSGHSRSGGGGCACACACAGCACACAGGGR